MLPVLVALVYAAGARADLPLRSPLESTARVLAVRSAEVVLVPDSPGRPVLPGMVMTVLHDGTPAVRVRVESLRSGQALCLVVDRESSVSPVPADLAVAPCPIPVTAVSAAGACLALPLDHKLPHGAVLLTVRDGSELGSVALSLPEDGAPAAVAVDGGPQTLRVGDVCYATEAVMPLAAPAPAVPAEPPPPLASAVPEALEGSILVTGATGQEVHLRTPAAADLPSLAQHLTIVRDGEPIAVIEVASLDPLGGQLAAAKPGTSVRAGDWARPFAGGDVSWVPQVQPEPSGPAAPHVVPAVAPGGPPAPSAAQTTAPAPEPALTAGPVAVARPNEPPQPLWVSPPRGLSFSGPTGLLRTPNAEVQPTGVFRFGRVHASPDLDRAFPGNRSRSQFTVGMLPHMEFGTAHFARYLEDLTYHAKLQLVPEQGKWPTVAVGTMDERAAYGLPATRFVALSKHFLSGRVRGTLGYGDGGLTGPFGGIEAALNPTLTLLAEYDTESVNFGLRATPHPRLHIDLAELNGTLAGQITYALVLDDRDAPPAPVVLSRPTGDVEPQPLAERLQDAVCALGMENVRTEVGEGPSGPTAVVSYENRRYLHDETEALGRVLASAVCELPPGLARLVVIVTKSQVPVLRVATHPDDYVRFLSGELPVDRYLAMLEIDASGRSPIPRSQVRGVTALRNPTRFTADIALTPLVRTLVGTERLFSSDPNDTQSLAVRVSLRPDVWANIGRGLDLRYSHGFHVVGALGADVDPYLSSDALLASYTVRPLESVLARAAAGEFLGGRRGVAAEAVTGLSGGRLSLRGVGGYVEDTRFFDSGGYHWTYVGDVRYRVPSVDTVASLTFGRYIDNDRGFTFGVRKHFTNLELELQFRHSDFGDVLLFGGTLPIGRRAWDRPDPLRLRLGDRLAQSHRALIPEDGEPGLVTSAMSLANELEEFDLTDSLLNRDRLNAAYIRAHLPALIHAARTAANPQPSPAPD